MKNESEITKVQEPNYTLLAFQYPSVFEKDICIAIFNIMYEAAKKKKVFLPVSDIEKKFFEENDTTSRNSKDNNYLDYLKNYNVLSKEDNNISSFKRSGKLELFNENLQLLINSSYINSSYIFERKKESIIEVKVLYIRQLEKNIFNQLISYSRKEIKSFIINRITNIKYPFSIKSLVSLTDILNEAKNGRNELRKIIYSLIKEDELVDIDLHTFEDKNLEKTKAYLFPGRRNLLVAKGLLEDVLIPSLGLKFQSKGFELKKLFKKLNGNLSPENFSSINPKTIYQFCSKVIELKKNRRFVISNDEFQLSHLILSLWLHLQDDPLYTLSKYPEMNLEFETLKPLMKKYIVNFSQIEAYLKKIKGFLEFLPQVIDEDELIAFFEKYSVKPEYIKAFISHLPESIRSTGLKKKLYFIAKAQIINAIIYLYENGYYKKTSTGKLQFEVLAKSLTELEINFVTYDRIIEELKTTSTEYDYVKNNILKESDEYAKYVKSKQVKSKKERSSFIRIGSKKNKEKVQITEEEKQLNDLIKKKLGDVKKFYTSDELDKLSPEEQKKIIDYLSLWKVECYDNHKNHYIIYVKRDLLTFDDARFFRSKPSYELMMQRFEFL